VQERERFTESPHNAYPGLEGRMGPEVSGPLAEFFMLHLRKPLGARRTVSMYSRLSIATLQPHELGPLQQLCHRDRFGTGPDELVAACTLYLFAFAAEIGSPPGYLTTSNAHFELLGTVPAAFNRAVFYDGSAFHSSHITEPARLSPDPARGRLTLNGFFICRRNAV
jgi:hypothetical protein